MNNLARYDFEMDAIDFDTERLRKAGLELNILYCKNKADPASERTLDLLILKALKNYFKEEKVISFNSIDCYMNTLKTISKKVEAVEKEEHILDYPLNPDSFSQEQILQFYQDKRFGYLVGMTVFVAKEYKRRFI
ncbi:MAG: hypothetical protein V1697_02865 [Candidatus Levyibacteriota bacterium]